VKCYECGANYQQKHGTFELPNEIVGKYRLDSIDYMECEGCGAIFLDHESWKIADREEERILSKLIGNLSVSEFINATAAAEILGMSRQALHKHKRIRRGFIYSTKVDGRILYHKKSVELFKATGDGRFSLVHAPKESEAKYVFVTLPSSSEEYGYTSYPSSEMLPGDEFLNATYAEQ
jgi:hypothetical protein